MINTNIPNFDEEFWTNESWQQGYSNFLQKYNSILPQPNMTEEKLLSLSNEWVSYWKQFTSMGGYITPETIVHYYSQTLSWILYYHMMKNSPPLLEEFEYILYYYIAELYPIMKIQYDKTEELRIVSFLLRPMIWYTEWPTNKYQYSAFIFAMNFYKQHHPYDRYPHIQNKVKKGCGIEKVKLLAHFGANFNHSDSEFTTEGLDIESSIIK